MHWINSIALRYFFSKKKDKLVNLTSKIAIFSVSFAITMLIVSFSVIRGFEETILNKVLADQGHIVITSNAPFHPQIVTDKIPKELKYEMVIETSALVVKENHVETVLLRGVENSKLTNLKAIKSTPTDAKSTITAANAHDKGYKIYVGNKLAKILDLEPQSNISFVVPIKSTPPFDIMPEVVTCCVEKTVQFNLHDLNRYGVFMSLNDAQKALNIPDKIHKIICFGENAEDALKFVPILEKQLPMFNIYSWKNINMLFADIMRIQRNMVSVILFAIIFLATIASVSSLTLFIYIKKREISILRILGATRKNIVSIFLRIGMLIAVISSMLGLIFGVLIAWNLDHIRKFVEFIFNKPMFDPNVYLLPAIPVSLNFFDIAVILLASLIVSFLAAIIPAYKSASVDVLESLQ